MTATWFRVEALKEDIVVVDCGYLSDQGARDRADAIFALGISRSNLDWGPSGDTDDARIHIMIPKTKVKKVFASLSISDKKTWYGATHSYLEEKKQLCEQKQN